MRSDDIGSIRHATTHALIGGGDDQVVVLDIGHPRERQLLCVIVRGTANVVIDGVLALQYETSSEPMTPPDLESRLAKSGNANARTRFRRLSRVTSMWLRRAMIVP